MIDRPTRTADDGEVGSTLGEELDWAFDVVATTTMTHRQCFE